MARVEEEIATLRTVLTSKVRHASELKRKLGITVWREITDDVNHSLKTVKESQVYQVTESAIKTTAEKTSSILGGLTSGFTSKLSQMKKSDSYRSIEERVGSAYENVKVISEIYDSFVDFQIRIFHWAVFFSFTLCDKKPPITDC